MVPYPLTQGVGDARFHVVGADMADSVLVLRLGQHHDADVPECVDSNLREVPCGNPRLGDVPSPGSWGWRAPSLILSLWGDSVDASSETWGGRCTQEVNMGSDQQSWG